MRHNKERDIARCRIFCPASPFLHYDNFSGNRGCIASYFCPHPYFNLLFPLFSIFLATLNICLAGRCSADILFAIQPFLKKQMACWGATMLRHLSCKHNFQLRRFGSILFFTHCSMQKDLMSFSIPKLSSLWPMNFSSVKTISGLPFHFPSLERTRYGPAHLKQSCVIKVW